MSSFLAHPLARSATALRRPRRQRRRTAHTLVEILLALGLSMVILTAVYAALDQHWRYAEAGQRQTERMQVTRALFERIAIDLRSAVFRPDVDLRRPLDTGNVKRIDVVQPGEAYVGRSVGIVGDAEKLIVQVNITGAERTSASRTVLWKMHPIEAHGGDGNRAAARAAATSTDQAALALTRLARDNMSPTTWADVKTVSPDDLVAAEVETIRFRYFARGSWFDQWDSVSGRELPQAVEITIGFRRGPAVEQPSGQASAGEYRLVVPIPASEA